MEERGPFNVVLASAGTGKTFRLTNHYLRLVVAGCRAVERGGAFDPATVLATTFTRKAAGEIVERVFERLVAGTQGGSGLKVLREFVDGALTAEECERVIVFLAERLHRLNIVTIDALLARMAASMGMELGLPVGWKIVDGADDAVMREEAIGRAMRDAGPAELGTLLRLVYSGGFGRAVQETIARQVENGFDAYLMSGMDAGLWWQDVEALPEPDIESAARGLAGVAVNGPMEKAVATMLERATERKWKDLLGAKLAGVVLAGGGEFHRKPVDDRIIGALGPIVRFASAQALVELAGKNRAAAALIERFDEAYSEVKAERAALRFDDLPRSLLAREVEDMLPTLYFRLDASVRHLLLDEFQDTSVDQFRVLEPMIDEIVAHRETERTVFVVGDEKQSLYGWRGAKSKLLAGVRERWPVFDAHTMARSQRSSAVVLDAVNAVFGTTGLTASLAKTEASIAAARDFGESFAAHTAAKELGGEVTLVQVQRLAGDDGVKPRAGDHLAEVVAEAVRRVRLILEAVPDAHIAVLTRANKPIANIIYELKKCGIVASGEGGTPVTDAPMVAAAMSAIQLAAHPGDSASFALLAMSPFAGVLECEPGEATHVTGRERAASRVSQRLRERVGREGLGGLLRWLQAAGAHATDRRGLERFEQLLGIAERFEAKGGVDLAEFAATVEATLLEDATPCQVRVMTVHKAKGLEFDAVVLIGLDRAWGIKHTSVLMKCARGADRAGPLDPVEVVTLCPSKEARGASSELAEVYASAEYENVSGELCCLYVGMTRAKHALHMIIGPLPANGEALRSARLLFDTFADGEEVLFGERRRELHASGDVHAWKRPLEARGASEPAAEHRVLGLSVVGGSRRRMSVRAPSAMEGGSERRLSDVLSLAPERGRTLGTFMHAMYETIEWIDGREPSDETLLGAIRRAERMEGPADQADAELIRAFRSRLGPRTRRALSRDRYAGRKGSLEVRREYPVAGRVTVDGEAVIVRGTIDRLVVGVEDGRPLWAEILDFKTDAVGPDRPEEFALRKEHYRPQIEAYMRTVAAALRLERAHVGGSLLFVSADEVVEITAS